MPIHVTIIPMVIYGVIFLSGLINAINPRFMWRIFESWKATKEPSSSYFRARRISGIVAMLIITALMIYPYFMK